MKQAEIVMTKHRERCREKLVFERRVQMREHRSECIDDVCVRKLRMRRRETSCCRD